jgi:hypothetical protein
MTTAFLTFLFILCVFFCFTKSASKNLNLMEWDKLWTINKKIIDHVCEAYCRAERPACALDSY